MKFREITFKLTRVVSWERCCCSAGVRLVSCPYNRYLISSHVLTQEVCIYPPFSLKVWPMVDFFLSIFLPRLIVTAATWRNNRILRVINGCNQDCCQKMRGKQVFFSSPRLILASSSDRCLLAYCTSPSLYVYQWYQHRHWYSYVLVSEDLLLQLPYHVICFQKTAIKASSLPHSLTYYIHIQPIVHTHYFRNSNSLTVLCNNYILLSSARMFVFARCLLLFQWWWHARSCPST